MFEGNEEIEKLYSDEGRENRVTSPPLGASDSPDFPAKLFTATRGGRGRKTREAAEDFGRALCIFHENFPKVRISRPWPSTKRQSSGSSLRIPSRKPASDRFHRLSIPGVKVTRQSKSDVERRVALLARERANAVLSITLVARNKLIE